jgi:hypothetical protein
VKTFLQVMDKKEEEAKELSKMLLFKGIIGVVPCNNVVDWCTINYSH